MTLLAPPPDLRSLAALLLAESQTDSRLPVVEVLAISADLLPALAAYETSCVLAARSGGARWVDIATALGTYKEQAHRLYGPVAAELLQGSQLRTPTTRREHQRIVENSSTDPRDRGWSLRPSAELTARLRKLTHAPGSAEALGQVELVRKTRADADAHQVDCVIAARRDDIPWLTIAAVLGVPKYTTARRFGPIVTAATGRTRVRPRLAQRTHARLTQAR